MSEDRDLMKALLREGWKDVLDDEMTEFPGAADDDGKAREDAIIQSRAMRVLIGINWVGQRQVLEAELASRESRSSWHSAWFC